MVQLMPEGWTLDDYFAYCERSREHQRRREEAEKVVVIIEETWQLALFGEESVLVQECIVGRETRE